MILIAGVGYSHLTDLSFGPLLVEELQHHDWPEKVQIEDLSYGPIAVLQWLQEEPGRFERAIFAGAMQRDDAVPGELRVYRWEQGRFSNDEVQERVAEGVTGIVSLENLLVIAEYFGALPENTLVIELEPPRVEFGLELSAPAGQRLTEVRQVIEREVFAAPAAYTNDTSGLNGGSRHS